MCMYARIYVYMYVCMYVHMYVCIYVCMYAYIHTCVLPPVASCIRDRDNDAAALKHEKNDPTRFIMPKARNSYT